jgi:hypothetical protein
MRSWVRAMAGCCRLFAWGAAFAAAAVLLGAVVVYYILQGVRR